MFIQLNRPGGEDGAHECILVNVDRIASIRQRPDGSAAVDLLPIEDGYVGASLFATPDEAHELYTNLLLKNQIVNPSLRRWTAYRDEVPELPEAISD